MVLLDTDVMIDVLRGYGPAIDWLQSTLSVSIGLPGIVAMELLQGTRNRREQQQVEQDLRSLKLYWPSSADCQRALDDFASHHLSHSIGILDALIAETAIGLDAELATFNVKHYSVVARLTMQQPYERRQK